MTTRKKRTTRGLTGLRASDRTATRQREFELFAQLHQPKRRNPQVNRTRERARPVCGYCAQIKITHKTSPLCQHCWCALGCPKPEKAKLLVAEQQRKRAEARRPDGNAPW